MHKRLGRAIAVWGLLAGTGCHGSGSRPSAPAPASGATIGRIYFWRARPGKLEEYSRYIRDVAEGFASLGADYDLRPKLAQMQAPALVVEGEQTTVPLEATRAFAAALPQGRLMLVPQAGHQSWLDRPDLFFPLLDDFIRGRAIP